MLGAIHTIHLDSQSHMKTNLKSCLCRFALQQCQTDPRLSEHEAQMHSVHIRHTLGLNQNLLADKGRASTCILGSLVL